MKNYLLALMLFMVGSFLMAATTTYEDVTGITSGGGGGSSTIDGLDSTIVERAYESYTGAIIVATAYNSGTGATSQLSSARDDKDHPGNYRHRTGSTAAGISNMYMNQPTMFGNGFTYKATLFVDDLSTGVEEYIVLFGKKQDVTTGVQSHGVYLLYDRANLGANWHCVADDDSGTTSTDTGVAVVADQWHDLSIVMNAGYTSVTCAVDGTSVSVTTNFPDSAVDDGYRQLVMEKSVGTTEVITYVDYMLFEETVDR